MFEPAPDDALPSVPQAAEAVVLTRNLPSPQHNILFGPLGLRAGWGLLLFFATLALLTWGYYFFLTHGTEAGRAEQIRYQAENRAREAAQRANPSKPLDPILVHADKRLPIQVAQAVILFITAGGMAWLERRRFAVFGLRCFRLGHLLGGAATGLVALSLLAGALRALHVLIFDDRLLDPAGAMRFGLLWLLFFAIIGLFEEFLYRGYIQYTLTRGLLGLGQRISSRHPRRAAFWLAAVLWSLLFLSGHLSNRGENAFGLLAVFVSGLVFAYALWRTGSLWWGIGFHMTWDWAESFLFGVPDSGIVSAGRLFSTHTAGNPLLSGGSAGPEGSLLVLPTLLLVFLVVRLVRPGTQPPLEPETTTALSGAPPAGSFPS